MSRAEPSADLRYTPSHEWVRTDGEDLVIGITDHAQSELTDVVFVDLPAVGKKAEAKAAVLVLESVKTVADVYAPTAGTIVAVNEELRKTPGLVNEDPYGRGWLVRMKPNGPIDASSWLTAAQYQALIQQGK
jgi:glycine cleavage system H protein